MVGTPPFFFLLAAEADRADDDPATPLTRRSRSIPSRCFFSDEDNVCSA
jgi:hypothetical protein